LQFKLLLVQAKYEKMVLMTTDEKLVRYDTDVIVAKKVAGPS
jgi:hypothetical protein